MYDNVLSIFDQPCHMRDLQLLRAQPPPFLQQKPLVREALEF